MKKYVLTGISAVMMAGAAMITTSCDTENDLDVINPNQAALDANWLEKFGDIDPNQNWCFATSAKASVAVYGIDALSDYQLQIYTENPIHSNNALLMASKKVTTDANGNASVNFDAVDVLKGQTMFYACYMDRYYRRAVKPVSLVDGVINAQFGTPGTRANYVSNLNSGDGLDKNDVYVPNPETDVMAKYPQAKEVSNSNKDQNWDGSPDFTTVMIISKGNTWNGNIGVLATNSNYWGYARTLYVDGTWNLDNQGEQKLGNGLIVVGNGGKIIIPQNSQLRTDNGGRIVVLPGGSIEGAGELTFCNGSIAGNEDYIAEGATVNIGTLNNNGGVVYNNGTLIANEIQGGAVNSIYVNRNKMIVDHSTAGNTTANTRIYNTCYFESKNDFACKDMYLFNPSYVQVGGNLEVSQASDGTSVPSEIIMAPNSRLNVIGAVSLNATNVVGPTGNKSERAAIFECHHFDYLNYDPNGNGYFNNNLFISVDKTDIIGRENKNWYNNFEHTLNRNGGTGASECVRGEASYSISGGSCANGEFAQIPDYNPQPGTPDTPQPQTFIIACEDMGDMYDVDFNDVVFSVGYTAGDNKIIITPLAAGGVKESYVCYDGKTIKEIHNFLGVNDYTITNTTNKGITAHGSYFEIPVDDENWSFAENLNKFSVRVKVNDDSFVTVNAPEAGKAPFMIAVPADWEWPREYVNIEDAYPGFRTWSQNANATNWNLTAAPGQTVSRNQ